MIPGIEPKIAEKLVAIGLVSADAFEGVSNNDLIDAGFTEDESQLIIGKVSDYVKGNV